MGQFTKPFGTKLEQVQGSLVVERDLDQTGKAFINAQFPQPLFVYALVFIVQPSRRQVVDGALDNIGRKLAMMEYNQGRFQALGDTHKLFVIRVAPRIPIDFRHVIKAS